KKRLQITDGKTEKKSSRFKLPEMKRNVFTRNEPSKTPVEEVKKETPLTNVFIEEAKTEEIINHIVEEKEDVVYNINNERRSAATVNYQTNDLINKISDKVERVQIEGPDRDYYEQISKAIEDKLAEFNINTKIVHIRKGPVV